MLEIASKLGYKFAVLDITIREFDGLLKARIEHFDTAFLSKLIDPEDIYNACERRNLNKTDLDKIRMDITNELATYKVSVIPNTTKYENKAKFSDAYEQLKTKRNSSFAALHDATCIEYVKEKRGRNIYEFDKVPCWFINNSSSRAANYSNGIQPYYIKAEELLNLLWLASPMVKSMISSAEISSVGLSRLVSATLDDALPSAMTIRKLDENIQKYAKGNISDDDIIRVSKSIAARTVQQDIETLNEEAEKEPSKFVESLNNISKREKQKEENVRNSIKRIFKHAESKTNSLNKEIGKIAEERKTFEQVVESQNQKYSEAVETNILLVQENKKIKYQLLKHENEARKLQRNKLISSKVFSWRLKAAGRVAIALIVIALCALYAYYKNGWDGSSAMTYVLSLRKNLAFALIFYLSTLLLTAVFIPMLVARYNANTVNAFISKIDIPPDLKEQAED